MRAETYWKQALDQSEEALRTGSLIPLQTRLEQIIGKDDTQFELRTLESRLPKHLKREGPKPNPFQPWDPQLEVARPDADHALILNKYPVQRGHMLLITADWAAQDDWLTISDWESFVRVDDDTSGLWFFNSGPIAGASQPHRHLQLLPRQKNVMCCPRDRWFQKQLQHLKATDSNLDVLNNSCSVVSRLSQDNNQQTRADALHTSYLKLAQSLGLGQPSENHRPRLSYNLLLTPQWMAMVIRRQEGAAGFSVNGLGFAGYLLATAQSDLNWLKRHGPEALLRQVVPEIRGSTVVKTSH